MSVQQDAKRCAATKVLALIRRLRPRTFRLARRSGGLLEREYEALAFLALRSFARVGQIQEELGCRPSEMSRIMRCLEKLGFIRVAIGSEDRRCLDVSVTAAGLAALEAREDDQLRRAEALLENLSEADLWDLEMLLGRALADRKQGVA